MYTAALLQAQDLRVSGIGNTSASFQWSHAAENNVHHIKFKVHYILQLLSSSLHMLYSSVVEHVYPYPPTATVFRDPDIHQEWRADGGEVLI